jgi:acyl-coenzyme A thioesterase PaaI-like protein
MPLIDLPHTPGCLVCGRENPHGLKLDLQVDDATGIVRTTFTPAAHHIGFPGVVHGGALATVIDEAMVWAATWAGKRFCLCGEMNLRYRKPAVVGQPVVVEARVELARGRLLQTSAVARSPDGTSYVVATGKYVPLSEHDNAAFVRTLVDEPTSRSAFTALGGVAGSTAG